VADGVGLHWQAESGPIPWRMGLVGRMRNGAGSGLGLAVPRPHTLAAGGVRDLAQREAYNIDSLDHRI